MKRTPPKLSKFWRVAAPTDLFVQEQRAAKLDGFVGKLAAIDELVDFAAIATAVEAACPAPDRSRGGRPPYATEVMVRLLFLQALYGLSDEESEYQILGRRGFHCFCRLEGELHLPDARTLWRFKQRLAAGGLGGGRSSRRSASSCSATALSRGGARSSMRASCRRPPRRPGSASAKPWMRGRPPRTGVPSAWPTPTAMRAGAPSTAAATTAASSMATWMCATS